MLATIWRLRGAYDIAIVDIFSGYAFIWAEIGCGLLRLLKKPTLFVLRGGNLPDFAARWPWRVRHLLNSAAAVVAPSGYLQAAMQPYRVDLELLPTPLDLRKYPFRLRDHPAPHLVWLRSFHAVYNPCLVPRVLKLLTGEFPEVKITMLGPDKKDGSLQKMQQLAGELDVLERIETPGAIPKREIPAWLDRGDIFINTTNYDNTPVSVMEALACGLCVVSTNVGGIPYLLEDGVTGLLVPPDDPEAMVGAIRRVLTEPGLAERLASGAQARMSALDWAGILPGWIEVIEKIHPSSAGLP